MNGATLTASASANLRAPGHVTAASLHPVPADLSPYEADGADARAHGYGLDHNPYVWTADRGEELAGHKAKRLAWNRGWHFPGGAPSYAKAQTVPALPHGCGSWVIIRRDTGGAVLETFSRAVCERVNAASYEVLTAPDYLQRLNRKA